MFLIFSVKANLGSAEQMIPPYPSFWQFGSR